MIFAYKKAFILSLTLAALACQAPFGSGQLDATEEPLDVDMAVAGTLAVGSTQTAAAAPPTATAEPEATAEPSETPTVTATPTPEAPAAQLTENTNCRTGPLAIYDLIATYLTGKVLEITGRNAESEYWYVADPDVPGRECWLWGRYAQVSGNVAAVPVFTPPPTPTPSYVWTGSWEVWVNGSMATMTITHVGDSVNGSLLAGSDSYSLPSTTSQNGRVVSGEAVSGGTVTATFNWYMLDNLDQFIGSVASSPPSTSTGSWCGARNGAGMPSPCTWP